MNEKQAKDMLKLLTSINDRLGTLVKQTAPQKQREQVVVERQPPQFVGRR